MYSAVAFLAKHLEIDILEVTHFAVSCFYDYVAGFLHGHPSALDPELAQIRARVQLTMAHRPVGWLWTQHTTDAQQAWGQDEHATAFVLRVLDHIYMKGHLVNGVTVDEAVYQIHRRLCMLQSIWLENGVWVGGRVLQTELKRALTKAMRDVELDWAITR
ncbi:hypothetical protein C8A03DRAFT_42815 [Achaetomium macrosporum]|uniref:Uncharacterized protein n=1 Tax=Achaetomium macrosporum TaxID=79813 RepID=A0AAN7HGJ6_9PEZI|nr:hypothetical protein C8A03DRAFT_42815 [Achaetomium macrosporum]